MDTRTHHALVKDRMQTEMRAGRIRMALRYRFFDWWFTRRTYRWTRKIFLPWLNAAIDGDNPIVVVPLLAFLSLIVYLVIR